MADQALAKAGALKRTVEQGSSWRYTLRYKIASRWKMIRRWSCTCSDVPGLVDFLLGNYLFRAIPVPSEIATLGETLQNAARKSS